MTTKSPSAAAAPSAVSRRARPPPGAPRPAPGGAPGRGGGARFAAPRLALADLDALVLAQRGRRAHADLDGEGQRLPLAGEVADVELGIAHRVDARSVDRVEVPAPHRPAHRLVEHALAPDALDDDRRRHLALAKAGHAQVLTELSRRGLHAPLDLRGGDLGLHADARFGQLCDGRLDGGGHGSVTIAGHWRPSARRRYGIGASGLPTAASGTRSLWRVAGCTCMSASRLRVACCMGRLAVDGTRSCSVSRPQAHCTVPAPKTSAPLGAR